MLYTHLLALIERPENQKKFADIERKLQMRGALPSKKPPDSSLGSEVSRESDSGSNEDRNVANLYDSLAAELKQKLSTGKKALGQSIFLFYVGVDAFTTLCTCMHMYGMYLCFSGLLCQMIFWKPLRMLHIKHLSLLVTVVVRIYFYKNRILLILLCLFKN